MNGKEKVAIKRLPARRAAIKTRANLAYVKKSIISGSAGSYTRTDLNKRYGLSTKEQRKQRAKNKELYILLITIVSGKNGVISSKALIFRENISHAESLRTLSDTRGKVRLSSASHVRPGTDLKKEKVSKCSLCATFIGTPILSRFIEPRFNSRSYEIRKFMAIQQQKLLLQDLISYLPTVFRHSSHKKNV